MALDLKTRSDDLEVLLCVVDSGGFSAAADVLDIQVARVSRAVSKIEKQLGVSILTRTTRRIELTEEGRKFVNTIRAALLSIQTAENEIISRGELPAGKLRINAASPFIFHQLIPLIHPFKLAYPDIELELRSNEAFIDLIEKRTDVAIRIGKLEDSTLHAKALGNSPLYIVASPEYIAKRGLAKHPKDLYQHDIIGFSDIKSLNKWPLKGGEAIAPTVTASNGETIRQLALTGNGIACLSGFMVHGDIASGALISLLAPYRIQNTEREQINAVFYKSSAVARRITAFLDFIKPKLTLK
ncbi:LysR family transcriptional regulator [Psychrosphaera sp. B3R10]|uniref:LysR family transcriptional regulator n=1 Tax=unclassified Psychrosphaera TaxID=2641570 RepID=UPI001C08790F|nr:MULTISPECIES: LysR family transcriptional regulator [unclassified Psychrosphaera]MBU2880782.1 LysR family transcriptional regulator [Psychrosphaera sp. I2R16]MBU2991472.1 LysR family transcriptional regulator [Psychrosphaera sp. B3R10]MDO6719364.1 LysR family transcriptional regulator [Psychrosphaera sp. 1_MG-2023]